MAPMYGGFGDDVERDIEGLIRERQLNRGIFDVERDELGIFRSGSAPPTVEGSRRAFGNLLGQEGYPELSSLGAHGIGGLISEDEMRAHPDYLSYYYSSGNFNPRMPPPSLSKEDWRARQRASMVGRIGDRRMDDSLYIDENSSSLFSSQPGFSRDGKEFDDRDRDMVRNQSGEWLNRRSNGFVGLSDVGIGARRKSFADVLQEQEEIGLQTCDNFDMARASDFQVRQSRKSLEGLGSLQYGSTSSNHARVQSLGSSFSHSFASGLSSSVSRSVTPDPQLVRRSPSPRLPPIGVRNTDNGSYNIAGLNGLGSFHMGDCNDITTGMSGLSLSKNIIKDEENHVQHGLDELSDHHGLFYDVSSEKRQFLQHNVMTNSEFELLRSQSSNHLSEHTDMSKKTDGLTSVGLTKLASNGQIHLPKQSSHASIIKKVYPEDASSMGSNIHQNADLSSIDLCGSKLKPYGDFIEVPVTLTRQLETACGGQQMNLTENLMGSGFHSPSVDPLDLYPQYFAGVSDSLLHRNSDSSLDRNFLSGSHVDYLNAYRGAMLAHEKHQYGIPLSKSIALNHGFCGSHAYGFGIPHPASSMPGIIHSHLASGSPIGQNRRISCANSAIRGTGRESSGIWSLENASLEGSSLLEDFKSNKSSVSFELSDIVGHVIEFSEDQFGSRFIQQKLETASTEDKNKIFPEILPKAHSLMTDVFGNYVIQKFFEHGTEIQRKQLAEQLTGHVLQLSLQMYGCRVIQKALEVVDVDQQSQMVLELDGNIMKCVRDQNGNHVIQKCIECVPEEKIQFIIQAFFGHVVLLSTHPYGCRVIQRVLEHCNSPKIQSTMMNEILQSVCTLAQNQYGNYVIQHVLQHGRSEERTTIIKELSGQIVMMSQQKYASNVVEKCLTFGTVEERQLLIDEILGTTDENEPLQAMMKDQFGNYVVQKVLEKCDDHNRELILSRIKIHLNALKKYTYGKHIVARVEKLVAAGERRIGVSSYS